jgi:hypothetical protein
LNTLQRRRKFEVPRQKKKTETAGDDRQTGSIKEAW